MEEVVVNKTITLLCEASGIPEPVITWYRDDAELNVKAYKRFSIKEKGWKLEIRSAKVDDTARYSCKAKNIAGEAEKYFDLLVLGKG